MRLLRVYSSPQAETASSSIRISATCDKEGILFYSEILQTDRLSSLSEDLVTITTDGLQLPHLYGCLNDGESQCEKWEGKGKGKAIQLQAWRGTEVSRSLRLPDFKTIGT